MPPEVHMGCEYDGQVADLYALGIILFTMRLGIPPFIKAIDSYDLFNMMKQNNSKFWKKHGEKKHKISDDFKSIINQMLNEKPWERLSIEEIKEHPWYEGPLPSKDEISTLCTRIKYFIQKFQKS